jgi:hypothetical protein
MLKIPLLIDTECFVSVKANLLMVFREEILLCSENHKRDINKICRHPSGSVSFQVGGTLRILTIVF